MNPSWTRISSDHRLQRVAPYQNVGVELLDVHLEPDESVVVPPEIITIEDDDDDEPLIVAEIITISDDSDSSSSSDDSDADTDDDSDLPMDHDNANRQDDAPDDGLYADHNLNAEEMADAYGPFRGCPSPLPGREPDVSCFILGFQLL